MRARWLWMALVAEALLTELRMAGKVAEVYPLKDVHVLLCFLFESY